ncbi:TPA: AraC family transcriptional regulator [Pseudomonas aeruginosa]|nr:AraC family transcriptional regulator [Pseudomonas aeruginosa]HCE9850853.1 AraC family transcriptional regulator [Pseudomonas aeruginosa]HCF2863347.1 AraC family transcriptional regulator [Pseudomonas aeruginosa]
MKRRSVLLSGVALSGTALANDSIFFSPLKYLGAEQQRSIDASRSLLDNLIPPSLPQYDNLAGKLARRAVLTSKKLVYVWTENFANVKGVPMARSVPLGELPNVDWLLKTAGVIVELIVNFVASLPASAAAQFERIAAGLSGDLEAARQVHEALLEEAKNDPAAAGSLLLRFTELQTRVIALLTRVGLLVDDILKSASNLVTQGGQGDGLNRFRAVFGTLRLPEVADSFRDDEAFAYWRVAGPNPLLIRRVDALPANFPLGEEQFRRVMGADDSLLEAAASRRLYLLDYAELGKLAPSGAVDKLLTGTGFAYAPIALFALGKDRARLLPVAIQCGQDPATHPMFVRPAESESDLYWGWQMAKTVVQVAEENYHEMFVHLAQTHLVSEAFCLATQRTLAPSHPLHVLLAPHFEGTLFINEGAARILLPSAGFIDVMFAAPIQDTQATAGGNRLGFDFYRGMLPESLKARNVDDPAALPDYPYRDDGLLVWNAIRQWAADYVAVYYASDGDVTGDVELAAWVGEVIGSGKVAGFRPITGRSQLVEVLTMVIFTASAQHAAVNFPQPSMMTYAPAICAMSAAPAPDSPSGKSEADWLKMMPPTLVALEKVNIYHLLGSVYHGRLGDYRQTGFPYAPVFSDRRVIASGGPLERFQARLKEVEATIRTRNQARRRPYEYLLPSRIPASTNI